MKYYQIQFSISPQDLTFAILKPNTSIKQDDQIPKEFSWEQILFN